MKSYKAILGSVFAVLLALANPQADAIPILGSSSGSFSGLSGCGIFEQCAIGGSGNSQVTWGGGYGIAPSKLTADAVTINTSTDAFDVVIGQLTWYNSATYSSITPDLFSVNWTLNINFTAPSASADSELFSLNIASPTNPTADRISGFTLADLSNLSFNLNGVTVSHFGYEVVDLGGNSYSNECSGADAWLTAKATGNNVWTNCEKNKSQLLIKASFTSVPEPATLALFSLGLLGVAAAVYRHRKSKAEQPKQN